MTLQLTVAEREGAAERENVPLSEWARRVIVAASSSRRSRARPQLTAETDRPSPLKATTRESATLEVRGMERDFGAGCERNPKYSLWKQQLARVWLAMANLATPKGRTFAQLQSRLRSVGLSREFVHSAFVPPWWDKEHEKLSELLPEVEISVARFLKAPIATVQDPTQPLALPPAPKTRLRKPKGTKANEFEPTVCAALAVAAAAVRNLKKSEPYSPLPEDPLAFRQKILTGGETVTLRSLLRNLWAHGIPVIHLANLRGMKKFRGMACQVDGRPVILLAWNTPCAPILLTDLAHEAGHIARGHVTNDVLMLDEDGEGSLSDDSELDERQANAYARELLGQVHIDLGDRSSPPDASTLATIAKTEAQKAQVDPGLAVHFWCLKGQLFRLETRALGLLDRMNGRDVLLEAMRAYLDFAGASETDSKLLRCVVQSASDP